LNFLDFPLQEGTVSSCAQDLIEGVKKGNRYFVLTLNSLIVYEYLHNEEYKKALKKVNYVVPDGSGVIKAVKLLYKRNLNRIPGIELMQEICAQSSKKGFKIYFLGAEEGIAQRAVTNLKEKFPELKVVGFRNGFFSDKENAKIVNDINQSNADFLFVGMGVPKQEIWISRNWEKLDVSLAMGVGGSFDVLAGKVVRAPKWMQRHGLEWCFRILQEPRKRLKVVPKLLSFALYVLKSNFREKRGESRDY